MDGINTHPLINSTYYAFASIRASFDDTDENELKDIKYGFQVNRGTVRGTSMAPLGVTRGQIEYNLSLVFSTRDAFERFQNRVQLTDGIVKETFAVVIQYGKDGEPIVTDGINFKIKKADFGGSNGPDPLEVSIDADVLSMIINGKPVVPEGS